MEDDPTTVDLLCAYELVGVDLTCAARHLVGPGGVVFVATGTTSDILWPRRRPALDAVLASVEVEW
ncbi:MAG: hypothetical protein ACR2JF_15125 [Iamia sp.]